MRFVQWLGYGCLAVLCVPGGASVVASSPVSEPQLFPGKTIGLVLTKEMPGHWESPGARIECPDGLQFMDRENWAALPEEERKAHQAKFGHRYNRGPNGESTTAAPWATKDPLPLRETQSKISYGFNLDGTEDGRETETTCKHEKFRSPDGATAVDNQLYRVMGCTKGWRVGGAAAEYRVMEFPTYSANRILIEISEVDDEKNDNDVSVKIYKGLDTLLKDSRGEFLPNFSQRVDVRWPIIAETRGRIENGVLNIDPVDHAYFPMRWNVRSSSREWYDMHIELRLTETGAEGTIGGYQDLEKYWGMYRRGLSVSTDNSGWSLPALYHATVRHADGRKDPKTGQCTAISSLLNVKAVHTFIIQPAEGEQPGLYDLRGY